MVREQFGGRAGGGWSEGDAGRRGGFGVVVTRPDRQHEGHGVGAFHGERMVGGGDASAVGDRPKSHGKRRAAFGAAAGHEHGIGAVGAGDRAHAPEQRAERNDPGTARGEANHQRAGGGAAKHLAGVGDAAALKRRARHRGIEVEFAAVIPRVRDVGGEFQAQVAERLIAAVVGPRRGGQVLFGEGVGLGVFPGEEQFAQSGKILQHLGFLDGGGATRPHAALVEVKQLAVRAAVHERADAAVAHGQGLVPGARGLAVPENGGGRRGGLRRRNLGRGRDAEQGAPAPDAESETCFHLRSRRPTGDFSAGAAPDWTSNQNSNGASPATGSVKS